MTSTATRPGFSRSVVSTCSVEELLATMVTVSVIASAYGVDSATRCCALTMREAAMSSIALVIFFVDRTALMR